MATASFKAGTGIIALTEFVNDDDDEQGSSREVYMSSLTIEIAAGTLLIPEQYK